MKTVVATYMVWMKDVLRSGKSFPDIALLLVGNEENGESEAWGTPFVMKELGLKPSLFIAGERTGEKGNELYGEICIENRGIMRFEVLARGKKGHSGVAGVSGDLSERLIQARADLMAIFEKKLTLKAPDGWQSQAKFPFINVGTAGIYNITPAEGVMGVEIRPIPQDDTRALREEVEAYCVKKGLEVSFSVMEDGVACDLQNPALLALIAAAKQAWGEEPKIGKKLPGTSARFAPGGQAVVWGGAELARIPGANGISSPASSRITGPSTFWQNNGNEKADRMVCLFWSLETNTDHQSFSATISATSTMSSQKRAGR